MKDEKRKCPPLSELPPGKLLQIAANRFRKLANDNLLLHGITFEQLKILVHIARAGRSVPQAGLQEIFEVRRSSMTAILQNMEKKGLLKRETAPGDARVKTVTLTDKGVLLDRELHSSIQSLDADLVKGFSKEEKECFRALLIRASENLSHGERNQG